MIVACSDEMRGGSDYAGVKSNFERRWTDLGGRSGARGVNRVVWPANRNFRTKGRCANGVLTLCRIGIGSLAARQNTRDTTAGHLT